MRADDGDRDLKTGCGEVAALLPGLAAGDLPDADSGRLRCHLADCAGCRARAAAVDPAVLFLALKDEPLPAAFWTSFDARLRERLAAESAGGLSGLRRLARVWGRMPRVAWLAPAAMAVLLGVTLYVALPGNVWRPRPSRPADLPQDPYRVGGRRPMEAPGTGPDRAAAGLSLTPPRPGAGAEMEDVASPGARVYRFEVGESGDETPVYFVVDESIDI